MNVILSGAVGLTAGGSAGAGPSPPPLSQAASRTAVTRVTKAARSRRHVVRGIRFLLSYGADGLMPEEEGPLGQGEDDVERDAGEGEDADGGEEGGGGQGVVGEEDDGAEAAGTGEPLGDDSSDEGEGV